MGLSSQEASLLESNILNLDLSNDLPYIIINEQRKSAVELSSIILSHLCNIAKMNKDLPVESAVITVPAYFNDIQRQATKLAAEMANIRVLRLISEPTAAAIAYGIDDTKEGNFVVYDFGGGTFDVSVLSIKKGVYKVLSTKGDTHLGGDDIDNLISKHLVNKFKKTKDLSTQELLNFSSILSLIIFNLEEPPTRIIFCISSFDNNESLIAASKISIVLSINDETILLKSLRVREIS